MIFDKVEQYCRENHLPIYLFEKRCGLGNGTVSGWKESNPSFNSIIKVAKEMGISIGTLMEEEREEV